ncbi:Pls/PosA family non-ribosomal peptide synthetase [Streptomyces sp. NPDC093675]|uniref:Pls/PosA family non-ribosomal peptide synthetase n=1 Tax=Streptomyces sp. NPDC093675 TaxID=3366049 RepID=UPI00382F38D2
MVEKSAEVLTTGSGDSAIARSGSGGPATTDTETKLAEVLADVACVEEVSADSNFFDDLGANSLVMAQFCARVRKRPDLPSATIKDIYRHPTIRSLAAALTQNQTTSTPTHVNGTRPASPPEHVTAPQVTRASRLDYVMCGTLQLLVFLAYSFVTGVVATTGYEWVSTGSDLLDVYLRSMAFGSLGFVIMCAFPIVAKWTLVGRWTPREFPVWSPAYLRFWIVKVLLHANPMILFVGNPLYVLYLRALGARIGKGVTILSRQVPVCTDLLTIGAGTIVRKDSHFLCYRAHAGRIQTGTVTIGRDAFIGEKTVLDIDTSMGDGTQLGHTSALYRGQTIPQGESHHGSPAQRTDVDHVRVAPARCGTLRRACFGLSTLLQLFLVYIPLAVGGVYMLFIEVPALGDRLDPDTSHVSVSHFLIDALALSAVLFFGFVVVGLAALYTVPRLLNLAIKPDKPYPLYGFQYAAHRMISQMTNIRFYAWLFGDSSFIVHYLRGLGYNLSRVEQTGSNFGTEVKHESPYLVSVGRGTMVADGLSIVNAEYSSTSFQVSRASIGPHNFLGNNIVYPAGGRTGENCLLATKVMIPLDGPVREGVGLLGSPCFEIPRSVERDTRFDHLRSGNELRRHLGMKNRYNLCTIALHLILRWLHTFVLTALGLVSVVLYGAVGQVVIACYLALTLGFSTLYYVLVERWLLLFRRLRPQLCSIYDPYFWWHERLWKVPSEFLNLFNGTPFKNVIWRLLGVRIGSRVFDDGCYLTERSLAAIGDGCTLNAGSKIQCHSQEDGTFKSDYSTLGDHCTLGVGAHVHYGVTLGDGAVLTTDSFLMKGEEVPANALWGGNPAVEMTGAHEEPLVGVESGTSTSTPAAAAVTASTDGQTSTAS